MGPFPLIDTTSCAYQYGLGEFPFGPPPPFPAVRPLRFSRPRDRAPSGLASPDPVWCGHSIPERELPPPTARLLYVGTI